LFPTARKSRPRPMTGDYTKFIAGRSDGQKVSLSRPIGQSTSSQQLG
jgi:hypothetical protein